ncbi:MAG: hypothetical protein K0Q79_1862 [Flavipsychrobacter sp.]|jgi:hypothetical protein|nr:hypothetical protein [Flavipsychrobacter sp.]
MRYLLLLLAIATISPAIAQDYCKQVVKDVSPDNKIFDYSSPADPEEPTVIKVSRSINVDPDYESDNFIMIFQIAGDLDNIYTKNAEGEQVEKEEWKLAITFDDNSIIAEDTLKISHDFTNDKLQAIRQVYYTLTENSIRELSTKKIKKFSLAGYEKVVTPEYATAMMNYVACIKKAK